jgi:hypothetical protein
MGGVVVLEALHWYIMRAASVMGGEAHKRSIGRFM